MHGKRVYILSAVIVVCIIIFTSLILLGKYFSLQKPSLLSCASFSSPSQTTQITSQGTTHQLTALNQKIVDTSVTPSLKPLLEQRKKLLLTIMAQNPTLAKQYFFSQEEEQKLGQVFSNTCMETPSSAQGKLSVWHIDRYFSSQTFYSLKTLDGKIITLNLTADPFQPLISQMNIAVQGIQLDNSLLVDGKDLASIVVLPQNTKTPSGHILEQASLTSPSGPQKMLVVPVQLPGSTAFPITNSALSDLIFNQLSTYYNQISFGKITITGDVTDPITMTTFTTCDATTAFTQEIQTLSTTHDLSQYGFIAFILNFDGATQAASQADCGNGTAGSGSIGKMSIGNFILGVSDVPAAYLSLGFAPLAHEFGHNLGLDHSNYNNCNGTPLSSSGCSVVEYGDHFDPMSTYNISTVNGQTSNYATPALDAPHEEALGWFNAGDLQTVTQSGSYTIEPIESTTTGVKALKIPRGNNDAVYVEYRQPVGVDSTLLTGGGGFLNGSNVFQGALIHILGQNKISTLLLTPQVSQNQITAAFTQGSTFTDPATGVTISVTSQTSTALTVQVTITTPLPTNPPLPTVTVAQSTVQVGQTISISWSNISNPQGTDFLGIFPAGAAGGTGIGLTVSQCTTQIASSGSCTVPVTNSITPGTYIVRYVQNNSQTIAISNQFTVATGTVTGIPTANPTNNPIVTNEISPTTDTTNPTISQAAGSATFSVAITLPGIGALLGDNSTPQHPVRTATLELENPPNQQIIAQGTGQVTYQSGVYSGTFPVTGVTAGSYTVLLKLDNTILTPVSQTPISVSIRAVNTLPQVNLLSGDFNNDNSIDIQDYNIYLGCYGNKICTQKTAVDLNDDGIVDEVDLNILLRDIEQQ